MVIELPNMAAPKFIMCPECHEKYDDAKKRRIIDSCGHPRCFSCLFYDNPCLVCEKLLRGRSRSWISSRESLQSADEDQDMTKSNFAMNGFLTKEQYLRTLYSYNPGSQENVSQLQRLGNRRGSLDISLTQNRRINLGRYSASALVLPTVSQKPKLYPSFSKESISEKSDVERFSIPFPSKELIISREFSASTQSLSSSPGSLRRCFDEIIEDDYNDFKTNHDQSSILQFQVTSPRSSGYWSEVEKYSDPEMGKNSSKRAELSSKSKKSVRELAIIDGVLSGNSSAWENTKALFRTSDLRRTNAVETSEGKNECEKISCNQTRRHSAPEWHFRKYLDHRKKQAHNTNLKVTDL